MIDLRTLLVVMITSDLMMAGILWLAFAGQFREGLRKWALSLLFQACTWAVIAGMRVLPETLPMLAANALMMASLAFQAAALLEFSTRRVPPVLLWLPPLAVTAIFLPVLENFPLRVMIVSPLYAAANAGLLILVLRLRVGISARTRWAMAACYGLAGMIFLARALAVEVAPASIPSTLAGTSFQSAMLLAAYVIFVGNSFCFLLMHKERADEATRRLATTDPLTGVFNRRTFEELAEREIARARRSGGDLSLLMIDLDHFKRINDRYGHPAGDAVLRRFVALVRNCLRKEDLLVRYGGEEFCVLLPATAGANALALAERIRALVADTPLAVEGKAISITVSIGIATHGGKADAPIDDLLRRADHAMYRAKNEGRNRTIALAA